MADNKNENQQSQAMLGSYDANGNYVDPYWVTFYDWFTGKDLNNADTEKSAYWDDSTLATYNTGNNKWGTNDKYTWENTRNTYTWYNADIKTADLDPNYQYGWLAQQQESIDNSYIANRNDNIASALYNEWRRSIEDVADFLNQQAWFQNSTAEQRQNTINSVWKRIGQIDAQNQQSNEQPTDPNKTPEEEKNDALNNMESDLNKSTAWELYGKVTADQSTAIQTLEDENSVYRSMNASRIQSFKSLQSMDSNSIASAIINGVMATDSQQMRDLMQYDPAKYQEVKQAEKKIRGQMNINTITNGEWEWNTVATNWQSGISNEITDFALNSSNWATSTADILNSVNSSLSSNQSAATASEQMATIEADMATLQNRMKNLKKEASQVFKWDVPQYIVNAYVANRTAEIQDQLSILENRYNAAYSRYQNEWEQTKWNAEFDLKQQELELKRESMALDDWATRQWIDIQWAELAAKSNGGWTTTTPWWISVPTTSMTQEQVWDVVDYLVQQCTNWTLWNAQCAAWVQKNYFSRIWIEISNLSSWDRKKAICTDLASSGYMPKKWDVVTLDTGASYTDSNWNKVVAWHMWIVVWVKWDTMTYLDWNGSLDSNKVGTEKPAIRTIKLNNSKIYGYYDPTKWNSIPQYEGKWTTRYGKEYDFSQYSGWWNLSDEEKSLVKWILEYRVDPTSLAKSWAEWAKANTRIRAAAVAIWWQDFDYQEDEYKRRYDLVKKWNNATQAWWELSRNATAADELMRLYNIYHKYDKAHTNFRPRNSFTAAYSNVLWIPATEEFNAALQVAASELAWALKGNASPSEQELKEYKDALQFSLSEEQFDSKVKEYLHGINNKMASEAQYYEKITGRKPQNIYNQYEWLPQFVSNIAWIELSNYFSDAPVNVWNTKRDVTPSKWNTNRWTTEQNAQQKSAADKAKAVQWF